MDKATRLLKLKLEINQLILDIISENITEEDKLGQVKCLYQAMNWLSGILNEKLKISKSEIESLIRSHNLLDK